MPYCGAKTWPHNRPVTKAEIGSENILSFSNIAELKGVGN